MQCLSSIRSAGIAAIVALLGGCTIPEIEDHTLTSVAQNRPGRGTATEIAVPPVDAPAIMIATIEDESFALHGSEFVGDDVRLLVSRGMTAWSGGEVGRVDLRPAADGETEIFAVVHTLQSVKGAPSIEGKFLPEWLEAVDARYAILRKHRAAGAYPALLVESSAISEPFATSGRGAALGFLAGGIGGAFAGADADRRRGMRTPWVHRLTRSDGTPVTVRSFSPARAGACIGLADYELEPVTVEKIEAANRALESARKAEAEYNEFEDETRPTYVDPAHGIALFVPLAPEAC
jgi:hypothetical protein